ncbi:MAG: type II toxin-antitoxin system VapC family toxin [Patulibacter sp.]
MPVADASVLAEWLGGGALHREIAALFRREEGRWWAPHLVDAEVGHVLRRATHAGELTPTQAGAALLDLAVLPITRAPHAPLLARAFELRDSLSFFDALYVALAEQFTTPLITLDARLARAAAPHIDVLVPG